VEFFFPSGKLFVVFDIYDMRYIKLYEEFKHDEIYDVMMSICEPGSVSFKESTEYPSSERVRIYEVSEEVAFDPEQYEEYLSGWKIITKVMTGLVRRPFRLIIFVNGDLNDAALSWLDDVYGDMSHVVKNGKVSYLDSKRRPVIVYYEADQGWDYGKYYINHGRVWSLLEVCFDMGYNDVVELTKSWLSNTYGLEGLTTEFFVDEEDQPF
jgi:hypothetical protein